MRRTLPYLAGLALLAPAATAQDFPTVRGEHPLLVTVDDLPIASRRLHDTDAAREKVTRDLLAVLHKHAVPAIGFVTWRNVGGPADVKLLDLWLEAGHELGNHSFGHLDYPTTDTEAYVADVEKGRAELQRFLTARGRQLRFFRFPYLREGDTPARLARMRAWLRETGQRNVPVTIDTQDWSFETPWVKAAGAADTTALNRLAEDYQHALRLETLLHTADGDALFERPTPQVLLVHANAVGAAQWDALFGWMKTRGFRFVSADEVMADAAIGETPEFVGRYGGSHWGRIRHVRRQAKAREDVAALLAGQAADWNRGDLEAFCRAYADDAAFVGKDGVTRGRAEVLARYRRRYPDTNTMGTLRLEIDEVRDLWGPEITPLGGAVPGAVHGASVVARWSLKREGQPEASGHTLLVLERRGRDWRIVHDASL